MAKQSGISIDLGGIEKKFSPQALKAKQAVFAQRVGNDMNKHCPVDEGTLRDSMTESSDFENGQIIWNTPYAKRMLNADSVRKTKNTNAQPQWPEFTKGERLGDWKTMAAELLGHDTNVTIGGTDA